MYYCFGCCAVGSVFTFAMEYDNLTFPEAVNMLAKRCGMALPDADESEEAKKQQNLRSRLLSINSEAGVYYLSLIHIYITAYFNGDALENEICYGCIPGEKHGICHKKEKGRCF